jgi:hypothetical protein
VIDFDELRRQRMCKKRYGRATLTISRTGSFGLFINDELSRQMRAFCSGKTTAEKVAWAWVRARVEGHSPSFRWQDADLERLVRLVADCSESPHFEAATIDGLAQELVAAPDKEREQFNQLSTQLSKSFAGISNFSRVFNPPTLQWARQQQQLLNSISRSFVPPRTTAQLAALTTPRFLEQMGELSGLTASARRQMFPTLQPTLTSQLAFAAGLDQRIRLPDVVYTDFAATLRQTISIYPTSTITPALNALAVERSVTIGQIVSAAREAAALAEREGDSQEAKVINAVTAEVVEVIEAPSPAKLEEVVAELRVHIDEQFDALERQRQTDEGRRQADRPTQRRYPEPVPLLLVPLPRLLPLAPRPPAEEVGARRARSWIY